jgi:hypothetical protein
MVTVGAVVYPVPAVVTVMLVILRVPAFRTAVAFAVVPLEGALMAIVGVLV